MELIEKARAALQAKKAEDVVVLDLKKLSSVTDYYVIATGKNAPHLKALANELDRELATIGARCYRRAGTPDSGWITADYLDAVVHLMTPETRSYYALEQLWNDAPRVGD